MAQLLDDARVEPEGIRDIIETSLTDSQINAAINSAHLLLDEVFNGSGFSEALLTQIELWLSGHFVAIRDPIVEKESVGSEWSATYQLGKAGTGLNATVYGQQAIALDYTGNLAALGQKIATLQVYSEYDDD